jgi:sugar/nucleoside kinase (ribokinase family)
MLTGLDDEHAACKALLERGTDIVALKLGAIGSTVYTPTEVIEAPPISVREVDPTGAGDCYGGAFIVGLLEGWDLAHVARFANVVGALAVTRQGPMEGAPYRHQVLARMRA